MITAAFNRDPIGNACMTYDLGCDTSLPTLGSPIHCLGRRRERCSAPPLSAINSRYHDGLFKILIPSLDCCCVQVIQKHWGMILTVATPRVAERRCRDILFSLGAVTASSDMRKPCVVKGVRVSSQIGMRLAGGSSNGASERWRGEQKVDKMLPRSFVFFSGMKAFADSWQLASSETCFQSPFVWLCLINRSTFTGPGIARIPTR